MKLAILSVLVLCFTFSNAYGNYYPDYYDYPLATDYDNYYPLATDYSDEDAAIEVKVPFCPYGKLVNQKCICPRFCIALYKPVCGSDGKTYSNLCRLQVASCVKKILITKVHHGVCQKPTKLPPITTCASTLCKVGTRCIETPTGAKCVQPTLKRCLGIFCIKGHECVEDLKGARCVPKCPTACTKEYDPVCGTDGVTYSNKCLLKVASCKLGYTIKIKHVGRCESGPVCSGGTARCNTPFKSYPTYLLDQPEFISDSEKFLY